MQRIRTIISMGALIGVLWHPVLFAQQREPFPGPSSGGPPGGTGAPEPASKAATPKVPLVPRASTFLGSPVRNLQGESLGKIEDLMIDPAAGRVAYAALAYGGFLGLGKKFVAVPLDALKLQPDGKTFVLNLSRETLKSVPGFDKDNWPQRPDPVLSAAVRGTWSEARLFTATGAGHGIPAVVKTVNAQAETITLWTEHAESVELKASAAILQDVQAGDSVDVKLVGARATEIRKRK